MLFNITDDGKTGLVFGVWNFGLISTKGAFVKLWKPAEKCIQKTDIQTNGTRAGEYRWSRAARRHLLYSTRSVRRTQVKSHKNNESDANRC